MSFDAVEFVECTNCGVVYKSRERAGALAADFYEQGYFHGRKSGRDKRFEHRSRKAASWILDALEVLKRPGKGARLLDVGCSLGYVLEGARRLGLASTGVDISEYAVNLCVERGYEAKVGRVDQLPYPTKEFDVVVLKHVLEHTPQPTVALEELRRVLNPDGVVLIAVPDLRYWKGDVMRKTYRYFRPDDLGAQHYVYYTAKTLTRLLETNGFAVRHTSKAVFRNHQAARSLAHRLWELFRYGILRTWVALGSSLRLQREVYLLASKLG
ncbi:MAG: Methyltransferase type 11 [Myxococcaceae bacterium]|nr:Methyltransferase type 11 [Myxococcaceae bacterium]